MRRLLLGLIRSIPCNVATPTRHLEKALGAAFLGVLLASCAATTHQIEHQWRQARYGAYRIPQASALGPTDLEAINRMCPAGMPQPLSGINTGATEYAVHQAFALEFSNELRIPLWVCEHLTKESLSGDLKGRNSTFKPDPKILGPHSLDIDYQNSGFDRGHQAPNGDVTSDSAARSETFYLSNVAPQVKENNEQIWKELEAMVRDWAKDCSEIWVITGGFLYDPAEEDARTADGWIKYYTIGPDAVAVPTNFYKIIARRTDTGWRTLAFQIENKAYERPYKWSDYVVSVRWIEERAGIDFMPELDGTPAESAKTNSNKQWNGTLACNW